MPTAAFSFGSFGDIFAILQLAWQLRAALHEVTGAVAEIRELIADIDSFTRALQQVKSVIDSRQSELHADVSNGIILALGACRQCLLSVKERVSGFESRMTKAKGAAVWRKYWSVAAWSILGGKKEVDGLRSRLFEQVNVIQTYLALSQSHDQSRILENVQIQGATVERVCAVVQDIQARFDFDTPAFHFFDPGSQQYYRPFARTSLQRLCDIGDEMSVCFREMYSHLQEPTENAYYAICLHGLTHQGYQHRASFLPAYYLPIDCFVFKEAAFGEWQVLLGLRSTEVADLMERTRWQHVLRVLAQRRHSPCGPCNCDVSCRTTFGPELQARTYWKTCMESYMDAAVVIAETVGLLGATSTGDDRDEMSQLCESLSEALQEYPDPEHIRSDIIPLLRTMNSPDLHAVLQLFKYAPAARLTPAYRAAGFQISYEEERKEFGYLGQHSDYEIRLCDFM